MNKKKVGLIIILLLLLTLNVFAYADNLPQPNSSFYVFDEGNIISEDVEEYIINTNETLFRKTGAQVVVMTINSLGDMDIKEYANRTFEKWGIGSKEYDNGVLMLISSTDREIWVEVGYGLEGALPDGKVGKILDDYVFPQFKDENYSDGIFNGFNSILSEIEKEYGVDIDIENPTEYEPSINILGGIGKIFLIILVILFLFIDFRFFGGWLTFSILRGARFSGGSSGSSHRSNRGGGGSSGGGGAGGRW